MSDIITPNKTAIAGNPQERFRDMGDGTFAEVVGSVPLTRDSTRAYTFNLDSLAQQLFYNTDGTLNYVIAGPDQNGNSYKQTYTYTSGQLTGISAWVKQ
jgi:hypothetical protein